MLTGGKAAPDPYLGRILLGHYRCLDRIGEGLTSVVYKVQHAKLRQNRAIKALRPELAKDPRVVEGFWREAAVGASLRHPNLAILHDVDAMPDTSPCALWELIDGPTLGAKVAESPLGPASAAVIRGLCGALDAMHRRGLAHLDLYPENILLANGDEGLEPRLIDYGEVRAFGPLTERTAEPLRIGYSAPEQLEAGHTIDARADVFALGALICFAFTGRPPLASPDNDSYSSELRRLNPAELRAVQALPSGLRPIVSSCLDPNPAARPVSAGAVRDAIRRVAREASGGMPSSDDSAILGGSGYSTSPLPSPARTSPAGIPTVFLEPIGGDSRDPIPLSPPATLGRGPGNSVLLEHPTVSKQHAIVTHDGSGFFIEDIGSRNGTSVNGRRVKEPTPVRDGDTVVVGDLVFRFRASA